MWRIGGVLLLKHFWLLFHQTARSTPRACLWIITLWHLQLLLILLLHYRVPITFVSSMEVFRVMKSHSREIYWLIDFIAHPSTPSSKWIKWKRSHSLALCFRVLRALLIQTLESVSATLMLSSHNEWAACFCWDNLYGQSEWEFPQFFARGKGCSLRAYNSFSSLKTKE